MKYVAICSRCNKVIDGKSLQSLTKNLENKNWVKNISTNEFYCDECFDREFRPRFGGK